MSSQNRIGLILAIVVLVSAAAIVFSRDTRASDESRFGDVSVSCGPSQRAVVQQLDGAASSRINVVCLETEAAQSAALVAPDPGVLAPVAYAPMAPAAVTYVPAPPVVQAAPVVRASSTSAPVRRVERRPSWQKRVLVVGGTAGAGAGIGALVGGKKGALIGAAIGGGGAAIVDQVKHR